MPGIQLSPFGTDRQSSVPCTALLSRLRCCLGLHAWLPVSRLGTHPKGRILVSDLFRWTMAAKSVGSAAGRWGEPTAPRVPQDESRKRDNSWFSQLSITTLFQGALWTHKTAAASSEKSPWPSAVLHEDAFLSLEEKCPSQWWKNFKKKEILKALFFFTTVQVYYTAKLQILLRKEFGLFLNLFSKCRAIKIYNDFSKLLLILWSHQKCAEFFKNEGESTVFFLEVNILRYNDDFFSFCLFHGPSS